jgi:hypothetical protein
MKPASPRYKTADEVDGESMKRAVGITTMLLDIDGVQLRPVSAKTVLHLLRKQGWIVA